MVLNQFVWLGNENKRLCIVHRELVQWDGGDLLYITIIPLIFVVTEFMDEKIEWNNFHYDYYVDNSWITKNVVELPNQTVLLKSIL